MRSKLNLLAIVGSQRRNGNSYSLAKAVLDSVNAEYEIVQLADSEVAFCNLCEKCISDDCVLEDDFNEILEKMEHADGIVFVVPKYLFVASKFLCFLERLNTIDHMRKHAGYERTFQNPDYKLFTEKPFCMFVTSGTGKVEKQTLEIVVDYIEGLGLRLIRYDKPPFLGISVKAGDRKGEVLGNKQGIEECRRLVQKLLKDKHNY
ncbi:MAG: flavodoxin family protein [Candidatus Bathyarchaeota archaeon]|nr:flavodoxin family protein [Candidatus Bathyarchaeota archaeon]MDH5747158.1 flavodoxin family protein [Candidatus Bathyarchaeota archaeon]